MDDLFKIYINFPVPAFSYLPFITLLPIPPDSYRDKAGGTGIKGLCKRGGEKIYVLAIISVLRGIGQGVNSNSSLLQNSKPCTQPLVDARS